MVPDENTIDDIFDSPHVVSVGADLLEWQVAARIRSLDLDPNLDLGVVVIVADKSRDRAIVESILAGRAPTSPRADQVSARWAPMTDAIKRVDGRQVLETVDREQLRVVGWPMVLRLELADRWAAAVLDRGVGPSEGRRFTAAALLSELVAIEPGLVVLDLDLNS